MLVKLSEDDIITYEASLKELLNEHNYDYGEIKFSYENYCLIDEAGIIIAYALIKESCVIRDKKDKFINKKKYVINPNQRKFINDFDKVKIECLYNLIRLKDIKYKGSGLVLIKEILKLKHTIYLATVENKLYKYYKNAGFKETSYFDFDINGIFQKVLMIKT